MQLDGDGLGRDIPAFQQEGVAIAHDLRAQAPQGIGGDAFQIVGYERHQALFGPETPHMHHFLKLATLAQVSRGVLELLIGDQASDKHIARLDGVHFA